MLTHGISEIIKHIKTKILNVTHNGWIVISRCHYCNTGPNMDVLISADLIVKSIKHWSNCIPLHRDLNSSHGRSGGTAIVCDLDLELNRKNVYDQSEIVKQMVCLISTVEMS